MYKHILVATDGSKLSLKAVRTAAKLAANLGARLSGFYVMPEYVAPMAGLSAAYLPQMSSAEFKEAVEAEAQQALAQVAKAAEDEDIPSGSVKATGAHPWSAIIDAARARKCDLIVMASHGRRGLSGLLLGSETHKVLTHSKVPVLVCR
jgi:nucleotide-binding universal stress UspA family protein